MLEPRCISHILFERSETTLFKPEISATMGRVGKGNLRLRLSEMNEKSDAGSISALAANSSPCILIFKAAVPNNLALSSNRVLIDWVCVEKDCIAFDVEGLLSFCWLVFRLGLCNRVLCLLHNTCTVSA